MRKEYYFGNISIQNNKFIPNFLIKTLFWHPQHEPGRRKKKTKRSISHKCFCLSKRIPALFSAVCTSTIWATIGVFFPFYCGISWHRTCHLIRFDMTSPIYHKLDSTYLLSLGVEFRKFQKHPIGAQGTGWAGWAIAYLVVGGSKV